MKEHELSVIPFNQDTIYLTEHEGEPYVPLRPIVENLGLDWGSQYRKVMADQKRWGVVMMTTPSSGGPQETLCIPLRKVAAFLTTIEPRKTREAVRPKLIIYQDTCDQVLWDYWTKGHAERIDYDALAASLTPPVYSVLDQARIQEARREGAWTAARLIMHCQKKTKGDFVAALNMANKIIHYRRKGMTKKETALLTGISVSALQTMENELRDCGYSYPRVREVENIPAVFPFTKAVAEVKP